MVYQSIIVAAIHALYITQTWQVLLPFFQHFVSSFSWNWKE